MHLPPATSSALTKGCELFEDVVPVPEACDPKSKQLLLASISEGLPINVVLQD